MRLGIPPGPVTTASHDAIVEAEDRHLEAFTAAVERDLRRLVREAVSSFEAHQRVTQASAFEAAPEWRVPLHGDLIDKAKAQEALDGTTSKWREEIVGTTGEKMGESLGISFGLRNELLNGVIENQRGTLITTAPEEMIGTLMGSLQESYDAGASIQNAASAMRAAGYEHSQAMAERIARTETVSSSNAASLAMAQGGTDVRYKVWMATADSRTRDAHDEADGQTVPIGEAFDVDGEAMEFPGDPDGSEENVINCRCTVGYADEPPAAGTPDGELDFSLPDLAGGSGAPETWGSAGYNEFDGVEARGVNALEEGQRVRDEMEARISSGIGDRRAAYEENERLLALNEYTGPNGEMINLELRDPGGAGMGGDVLRAQADQMHDMFFIDGEHAVLDEDVIVYRGMTEVPREEFAPGMVIKDDGFLSASFDSEVGWKFAGEGEGQAMHGNENIILRLHVPKGEKYLVGYPQEKEVIFDTGSRYLMVGPAQQQFGDYSTTYDAIMLRPGETAASKYAEIAMKAPESMVNGDVPGTWKQETGIQDSAAKAMDDAKTAGDVRGEISRATHDFTDEMSDADEHLIKALDALDDYKAEGFDALNHHLRNPDEPMWHGTAAAIKEQGELVKSLFDEPRFAQTLGEDTLVYRGMMLPTGTHYAGQVITDNAFMSTAIGAGTGFDFSNAMMWDKEFNAGTEPVLLRVHAPAGTKFLPGDQAEGEMILAPGTRYVVIGDSDFPYKGSTVSLGVDRVRTVDVVILKPGQTANDVLWALRK